MAPAALIAWAAALGFAPDILGGGSDAEVQSSSSPYCASGIPNAAPLVVEPRQLKERLHHKCADWDKAGLQGCGCWLSRTEVGTSVSRMYSCPRCPCEDGSKDYESNGINQGVTCKDGKYNCKNGDEAPCVGLAQGPAGRIRCALPGEREYNCKWWKKKSNDAECKSDGECESGVCAAKGRHSRLSDAFHATKMYCCAERVDSLDYRSTCVEDLPKDAPCTFDDQCASNKCKGGLFKKNKCK